MASGTTGAPHNIPFPVGADQYALTGDLQAMSSQIAARLSAVKAEASWDKTATPLAESEDMGILPAGIYRVGGGSVAIALGLPIPDVSAVTVIEMNNSGSSHSAVLEQWGYDGKGGVDRWQAWRDNAGVIGRWSKVDALDSRLLDNGEDASRVGTGVYGVVSTRANPAAPPGQSGSLTETPVGDSVWSQTWQTWTVGAADLLVRSQSPSSAQTWQRPESPRAVEWARSEFAALQASLTSPHLDGTVPSSAWSASPAETPMVVPTPDGSGQATHPSVIDVPGGWNGHRYWMAYTPYTYADNATEDPCVAWSDYGTAWTQVQSAFPLDDAPGGAEYNSDTNAVLHNGTLYVTWRNVSSAGTVFYLRTSTDGTTWTPRQLLWDSGMSAFSQSLVKTATGWRLWFVGGGLGNRRLAYIETTATEPTSGWGAATFATTPLPAGREPWHVEVHLLGGRWWGLLTDTNRGQNGVECEVRLMQSDDGITWDVSPTQLIPRLGHSHDVLYKSAATFTGDSKRPTISLWYSGLSADKGWWLYRSPTVDLHAPRDDWSSAITALNAAAT